jgi:hypothetical protein
MNPLYECYQQYLNNKNVAILRSVNGLNRPLVLCTYRLLRRIYLKWKFYFADATFENFVTQKVFNRNYAVHSSFAKLSRRSPKLLGSTLIFVVCLKNRGASQLRIIPMLSSIKFEFFLIMGV